MTGRCAKCGTSILLRATDKPFLDVGVDFMKPLFRSFGSVLIHPNLGLQLSDPIFGCPKLVGKLLGHIERMLAICLRHAGGLVKQLQNGLPGGIKLISVI